MSSSSTSQAPFSTDLSFLELFSTKAHLSDIPTKLASKNYLLWKAHVLLVLRGHGLLGYLTNELPCPPTMVSDDTQQLVSNPASTKWLHLD